MHVLLLTSWLLLPVAPINPLVNDTVPKLNLHFTAGVSSPSNLLDAGPEMSIKTEASFQQPFILRGGIEYHYNNANSFRYPRGHVQEMALTIEALVYRGTNRLTGYLGGGLLYSFNFFDPKQATLDSLFAREEVSEVRLNDGMGYRMVVGLRFQKQYNVEFRFTITRPTFTKLIHPSTDSEIQITNSDNSQVGSVGVSLGYLIPLRHL